MKKKILAVVLAVVILAVAAIGATLAWLMDKTEAVVNTFVLGNISISLEETIDNDNGLNGNAYKLIPGATYEKDPTVTVSADSEDCYLFVKVVEDNGDLPDGDDNVDALVWTIAEGWNELGTGTGIYYREITDLTDEEIENETPARKGAAYSVLANDKIQVATTLTKDHIDSLTATEDNTPKLPSLTITAYAIQMDNLTLPTEYTGVYNNTIYDYAWAQVSALG